MRKKFSFASRLGATVVSLGLLAGVTACGSSDSAAPAAGTSPVAATDAWVKATGTDGTTASMTGAFMNLRNSGGSAVTVISATTDVADKVEIHETVNSPSGMAMQPKQGGLPIPAGASVTLKPGGDHIMLMGLKRTLAAGDEVKLTLTFDHGDPLTVTAPVKPFTGANESYHNHATPSGN
ncbi:copper chaperone PCu(A)C [Amycolatopsis cynarae]|uniref:Copper chaperone PCu(A)C n=1 Tax=Amycolatopsis cynarae TaxID=2995223 RepID=A0ABY7BAB9_9PSEU|nr:copper chaperone PCu(A)C [Amycolatopsis sp. HUAS 11-8]WAL69295.1 copper chaperone PCu(A)C [Amycolatopsis sp. HUAS 11-8]